MAWPLGARAQQSERMRRIGVLVAAYRETDREGQARMAAFVDAFQRLGWSDGRTIRIESHWAAGEADRANAFAADLVRSNPDVLIANGNPLLIELHRLTSTVPIVFTQVSDPVGSGIVADLAHATLADVSHGAAAFRQSLKDAGFVEGAERRESNTAQRTTDGASVGSPLPRREP